jgi:hypothetical protein
MKIALVEGEPSHFRFFGGMCSIKVYQFLVRLPKLRHSDNLYPEFWSNLDDMNVQCALGHLFSHTFTTLNLR